MGFMFGGCYKLKIIKGIEKFNTFNVNNMSAMFQECNEIEELNLSKFNTSKVTDMEYMFSHCSKLKLLNIYKFNIKDDCKIENIFYLINKDKCKLICQDNFLNNLFYS